MRAERKYFPKHRVFLCHRNKLIVLGIEFGANPNTMVAIWFLVDSKYQIGRVWHSLGCKRTHYILLKIFFEHHNTARNYRVPLFEIDVGYSFRHTGNSSITAED